MSEISLTWLGQSGFLLQTDKKTVACDLYLSDFCQKISRLDHTRMTDIPLSPEKLDYIDHYLITHSHIDHFDPETVAPVIEANSNTVCYCPPSCSTVIDNHFAGKEERFKLVGTQSDYMIDDDIKLIPIPAAHEELEKDDDGEYISFSYLLLFVKEKKAVFFGGDTIPYPKQAEIIKKNIPEDYELTMVLPVNGRDKKRADMGFKGNFNVAEAVELANACGAVYLVPCHFGMFALNDIPEAISLELFHNFKGKTIIPEINSKVIL